MSKLNDVWYHYDDSVKPTFNINFANAKKFALNITYLSFSLPDNAPYDDPTAYVFMSTNMATTSVITQTGRKLNGAVLPIAYPQSERVALGTVRGFYQTPDDIQFFILDKNLNIIQTSRIVVTFRLQDDI